MSDCDDYGYDYRSEREYYRDLDERQEAYLELIAEMNDGE